MRHFALFSQLFLALLIFLSPWISASEFQHGPVGIFGLAGIFGSCVIMLISVLQMGSTFTIFVKPKEQGLTTKGLFRFSRNPIYLGLIICAFSWGLIYQSFFTFICSIFLLVVLRWKISMEEQFLQALYGQEYLEYKKTVKRFYTF